MRATAQTGTSTAAMQSPSDVDHAVERGEAPDAECRDHGRAPASPGAGPGGISRVELAAAAGLLDFLVPEELAGRVRLQ